MTTFRADGRRKRAYRAVSRRRRDAEEARHLDELVIEHAAALQGAMPALARFLQEPRHRRRLYDFGEALSEEGLAAAFSVSRTPVREALSHLQLEGLIDIAPQRGSFVFTPTGEDIERLCDFRVLLETPAIALAVGGEHGRVLTGLEQHLAEMEEAFKQNAGLVYVTSDHAFHQMFYDHYGNRYLQNAYALISSKMAALRTHLSMNHHIDQEVSLGEHRKIVTLFRARDMRPLPALLRGHIGRTLENFIDGLEKGSFAPRQNLREAYPFSLPAA